MNGEGTADVIIVGSGPAGTSAAWPLLEAGLRVLMLDAADAAVPEPPDASGLAALRVAPDRWRAELGAHGPIALGDQSPKFATPIARAVLGGFAEAAGLTADGFRPVGSLATGGLSRIWGALAQPYDAAELAAFPADRADLALSYGRVARRIGLSGDGEHAPVDGQTCLAEPAARLLARHRALPAEPGFTLSRATNAVLAAPREDRLACNACGLCLHGCARGAIYTSAYELPALRRFAHFTYLPGFRVLRLLEAGGHAVDARRGPSVRRFRAPRIVLAAGTIATSSLALRRLGLAGRPVRLASNPVGGTAFLLPRLIGAALPERSFGLGQLFYRVGLADGLGGAGVIYGADTLPLAAVADRLPLSRPTSLRLARALAPALLLATGYLPGSLSDNTLTAHDEGEAGRVGIVGHQDPRAETELRLLFGTLKRALRKRGLIAVPGSTTILPPGADAHPAATLPMGGTGPNATSDAGELRGCAGVFVVDGASLPTLAATHPTLTIMANADRIGRHIAAATAAEAVAPLSHVG